MDAEVHVLRATCADVMRHRPHFYEGARGRLVGNLLNIPCIRLCQGPHILEPRYAISVRSAGRVPFPGLAAIGLSGLSGDWSDHQGQKFLDTETGALIMSNI